MIKNNEFAAEKQTAQTTIFLTLFLEKDQHFKLLTGNGLGSSGLCDISLWKFGKTSAAASADLLSKSHLVSSRLFRFDLFLMVHYCLCCLAFYLFMASFINFGQ